jgi:CRISPR/Cas system type I-B associated protein Csh2 (Cas7 group RAMP superfamily)
VRSAQSGSRNPVELSLQKSMNEITTMSTKSEPAVSCEKRKNRMLL